MKIKFIVAIILLSVLMCCVSGCLESNKLEYSEQSIGNNNEYTIRDYGNGVLYFDETGPDFGSALSMYIYEHDAKVVSISADSQGAYGITTGYYVIVEVK